MEISEAIKNRRSIRRFLDLAVPDTAVETLIEAIRWAPSAGNLQARRFYFVSNRETRLRIARMALGQMFIASAPLVVVACGDFARIAQYGRRGGEVYVIQDVACAVENLMLQAHGLGLGSVWVGAFDETGISEALGAPDNIRPLAIVPIGYPGHKPQAPERLPREEVVDFVR